MYSFAEVRKTAAVAAGAVLTGLAALLADQTVRDTLPPQWVAVAGAVLTILAVFGVPNARPPVTHVSEVMIPAPSELEKYVPKGSLADQVINSVREQK